MGKKRILVILGSGLYDLYSTSILKGPFSVETPFGDASMSEVAFHDEGNPNSKRRKSSRGTQSRLFVMMRHGRGHGIPPHLVNYRANISAAQKMGCDYIIATASVGSLRRDYAVGSYVTVDQFIDFTRGRASSVYYEGAENFAHTDMTEPYSARVRSALINALSSLGGRRGGPTFHRRGTYVCTEGPRFETPAEIKMFRKLGGDVVGMTGVPEVVIANELHLPYAALAQVTNLAAGMRRDARKEVKLSQREVNLAMKASEQVTKAVLDRAIRELMAEE